MITSKERSKLLALSNKINTSVFVGKFGLTESVLAQIDEMLNDHELIKIGIQKNADFSAKEIIRPICEELNAEPVHAIGNKVIVYRYSTKECIEHVDYKSDSTKKVEEKSKSEQKPKILGRKTFDYKQTKPRTESTRTENRSFRKENQKRDIDRKSFGNSSSTKSFTKTSRPTGDYAPYKKDGVTIYKHKAGKPASAKKSNKK